MAHKIKLEIVSPEKVVHTEDINMLIVRSTNGELGILPNHAPLIAGLVPNAMRVLNDNGESLIAVSGGFMEVQPTKITILAAAAELPIHIDVNRAQQAYERAQKRLDMFKTQPEQAKDLDMERAQAALNRAKARLKATNTSLN